MLLPFISSSFLSPAIFLVLLLVFSLSTPPRSLWTPPSSTSSPDDVPSTGPVPPEPVSSVPEFEEMIVWIKEVGSRRKKSEYYDQMELDDDRCLGPYGFITCGDLTFWLITYRSPVKDYITPPSQTNTAPPSSFYQLQYIPELYPLHDRTSVTDKQAQGSSSKRISSENQCLTQKRHFSFQASPYLGPCTSSAVFGSHNTATLWKLSARGQLFYSYWGDRCLVAGANSEARTEKCSNESSSYEIITHMTAAAKHHHHHPDVSTGPDTDASFPPDIRSKIKSPSDNDLVSGRGEDISGRGEDTHSLLGGGPFTKLTVYNAALYVDAKCAASDPRLLHFTGASVTALRASSAFYSALLSPSSSCDRSLFIKFAMNVKSKTMMDAMVAEGSSYLSPENKKTLTQIRNQMKTKDFRKGMEIIFTWRNKRGVASARGRDAGKTGNSFWRKLSPATSRRIDSRVSQESGDELEDTLEIRIVDEGEGNVVLEFLQFPVKGLSHDLFLQFANDDPMSPEAKAGFANNFHKIMGRDYVLNE